MFDDPLDDIYRNLLGRGVKQEGRDYWGGQYDSAIAGGKSHEDAVSGIRGAIKGSDEYKALGLGDGFDHIADPYAAQHRVQARKSIARGDGVRAGTVASYSDMFNTDGTQRSDWVDEETWNRNKIADLQNQVAAKPEQDDRYDALLESFSGLQSTLGGYQNRLNDLQKAYDQQGVDMQNQWNNMMWDQNRPQNLSVRGVRTQNELPGWRPKTQGAGFFGRGGSGAGLTTSSINI
tara:strand:+ start:66 stop:767 length:702 start_codon:yes stop_codon:yes gene_type:complete